MCYRCKKMNVNIVEIRQYYTPTDLNKLNANFVSALRPVKWVLSEKNPLITLILDKLP